MQDIWRKRRDEHSHKRCKKNNQSKLILPRSPCGNGHLLLPSGCVLGPDLFNLAGSLNLCKRCLMLRFPHFAITVNTCREQSGDCSPKSHFILPLYVQLVSREQLFSDYVPKPIPLIQPTFRLASSHFFSCDNDRKYHPPASPNP